MEALLSRLAETGVIPVIKIEDPDKAVPLITALRAGGLNCAEITLRTERAQEAIARISRELPDILIGAGTILTTEQADRAWAAGAKFIVSPGFNPEVVGHCVRQGIPVIPGCSSPSDIERALGFGLKAVKIFPAEALGGVQMIKALSGPYKDVKFMPTGGIHEKNLNDYLSCPSVFACGGSWMADEALIRAGQFDQITKLTKKAVDTMLGFELGHVGVNTDNAQEAERIARLFCGMFGFEQKEGGSSVFAGTAVECMKQPYKGKNGHIGIRTNSVARAAASLSARGVGIDLSSAKRDSDGSLCAVYLEQEIGGFAVHLMRKGGK